MPISVDQLPAAAAALGDAVANPTTVMVGAAGMLWDGSEWVRTRASSLTGDAADGNYTMQATPRLWNGATYDRQRGNEAVATVLASAARTATTYSADAVNYNARGIFFSLGVSAKVAATTLSISLYTRGAFSGGVGSDSYATWTGIAAAVNADYNFIIYPGVVNADLTAGERTTAVKGLSVPLPRVWFVGVFPSDANSVTYSLTAYTLI